MIYNTNDTGGVSPAAYAKPGVGKRSCTMKVHYDIAVIGAGLLGCFVARSLARFRWSIAVFEKNSDVCTEMSKANTAILYPGYDPVPGSLKARLNRTAMERFETLCSELGVRYQRTGSMMVSFGPRAERVIREKYQQGLQNGTEGMELLTGAEALRREPKLRSNVTGALYASSAATLNPWELAIAAAEHATANAVAFYFNSRVSAIARIDGGYKLTAGNRDYTAKAVVNCAGLFADEVSNLLNRPTFRLNTSIADYILLDKQAGGFSRHIIMHEPEERGRGATIVPTVDGNLLLGPSNEAHDDKTCFETTEQGCRFVEEVSDYVMPGIPLHLAIRRFAGIRPSIVMLDSHGQDTGQRIHDLFIQEAGHPGFINAAGIKTPGLTCCNEIGDYISDLLLDRLGNPGRNPAFHPVREAPARFSSLPFPEQSALAAKDSAYGRIVCRCGKITEGEIRAAIRRKPGAVTLDGIKRRTGAQMGRCQGGFCTQRIIELLASELELPVEAIVKDADHSELLYGKL